MTQGRNLFHFTLLFAAVAALTAELLFISLNFDAYSPTQQEQPLLHSLFSQLGAVAKFGVVAVFIYLLIAKSRLAASLRLLAQAFTLSRFLIFFTLHLIGYLALLGFTSHLFAVPPKTAGPAISSYIGWSLAAVGTVLFWVLSLAKPALLRQFAAREWQSLLLALLIGALTWLLSLFSQSGWGWMATYTFAVSSSLFIGYPPELLHVDPLHKELGLGDFVVHISSACSGYEGIGLITAFTALYLYIERDQLRFPRVFWLFPLGATIIWLFNAVRIAVLVMIGYHWSPAIAIDGFHSQAGWITFILTSIGILWFVDNSHFFHKNPTATTASPPLTLPVVTLLPLIGLLATTLLDSALTDSFNYLYPLRVMVTAAVLIWIWKPLRLSLLQRPSWPVWPAALIVATLWVILTGPQPEADAHFQAGLDTLGNWSIGWLLFRVAGTTITIPIAEELAFRAYLLCKLSRIEVTTHGTVSFSWLAVIGSSLAFGFLHGAWLAGTIAGIAYALVRIQTGRVSDAIIAHALTNALLVVYAMMTGAWSVL